MWEKSIVGFRNGSYSRNSGDGTYYVSVVVFDASETYKGPQDTYSKKFREVREVDVETILTRDKGKAQVLWGFTTEWTNNDHEVRRSEPWTTHTRTCWDFPGGTVIAEWSRRSLPKQSTRLDSQRESGYYYIEFLKDHYLFQKLTTEFT